MKPNSARRPRLAPKDRIAGILVEARALLAEKGHENFSPADVAALCGVSEATIYRYFPTRRDLLIKLAEDWFTKILAVLPEIERQEELFGKLRNFVHHSLSVVRRDPALARLVLFELRSDPTYRSMPIFRMNRKFTSTITKIVAEGRAKGVFHGSADPSVIRDMVFGCIEHRTWEYLRGRGDVSVEADADTIAEIIFRGLLRNRDEEKAIRTRKKTQISNDV